MTSIKISNQLSTTSTSISNTFIDQYMPSANGEFVKVYLYLIRMAACGQAPTISDMADALNNTSADILRALKYWQRQGLLILHCNAFEDLEFIELLPISDNGNTINNNATFNVIHTHPEQVANAIPVMNAKLHNNPNTSTDKTTLNNVVSINAAVPEKIVSPQKPNYDMDILCHAFQDPELDDLKYEAEILLGKTLSPNDLRTLYYLHDQLGFSVDLISCLIEHCVSIGKKRFSYLEKVAISWHENNIHTKEDALAFSQQFSQTNNAIKRALGLNTWGEEATQYVSRWTKSYGLNLDIILEACNRAYTQTNGKNSIKYAAVVLDRWHEAGYQTLAEVKQADKDFQTKRAQAKSVPAQKVVNNSFHNFDQGEDVDYDAIISNSRNPLNTRKEN